MTYHVKARGYPSDHVTASNHKAAAKRYVNSNGVASTTVLVEGAGVAIRFSVASNGRLNEISRYSTGPR